jgi:hypothetical protein
MAQKYWGLKRRPRSKEGIYVLNGANVVNGEEWDRKEKKRIMNRDYIKLLTSARMSDASDWMSDASDWM